MAAFSFPPMMEPFFTPEGIVPVNTGEMEE